MEFRCWSLEFMIFVWIIFYIWSVYDGSLLCCSLNFRLLLAQFFILVLIGLGWLLMTVIPTMSLFEKSTLSNEWKKRYVKKMGHLNIFKTCHHISVCFIIGIMFRGDHPKFVVIGEMSIVKNREKTKKIQNRRQKMFIIISTSELFVRQQSAKDINHCYWKSWSLLHQQKLIILNHALDYDWNTTHLNILKMWLYIYVFVCHYCHHCHHLHYRHDHRHRRHDHRHQTVRSLS